MKTFFKKIFGSRNQRLLNDYSIIVSKINALEPEMQRCSDKELRKKTEQFQSELLKFSCETEREISDVSFLVRFSTVCVPGGGWV